jgi:transposase
MSALVATQFNPLIRPFYLRLLATGKPEKLALTACMRKLLIILTFTARRKRDLQRGITFLVCGTDGPTALVGWHVPVLGR